jgi:hypothetical protein
MAQSSPPKALMAEVKDNALIAVAYEIPGLGTFFRVGGRWAPSPDVNDEDASMVVIDPARWREFLDAFDGGTPMSMADVEKYEADQATTDLVFPPVTSATE